MNVNLIVYNHRGYGRSHFKEANSCLKRWFGMLNPSELMQDGESVLRTAYDKFIRGVEGAKIMVHGESLGGMAANYTAAKCQDNDLKVDVLFSGRTFASLDAVAHWDSGIFLLS